MPCGVHVPQWPCITIIKFLQFCRFNVGVAGIDQSGFIWRKTATVQVGSQLLQALLKFHWRG